MTTIGLLIVVTLIAFEGMAVATALPTAARALHGLSSYGLAFTGFIVANIVGMVSGGLLSDRRGPAVALFGGMVFFFAGLIVAGSAMQMWQLLAGRSVQGLGSGLLITAVYVVIGEQYGEALRPKVFAATSSAWVLPSLIGPPVSGFVTQHIGWRWVFLGLAPLVAIGGVLLLPVLRGMHGAPGRVSADPTTKRIDRSRLLRAVAVGAAIAELAEAGQHPDAVWLAIAPVSVLALVWGLRGILPPGTFTLSSGVGAAVALRALLAGAMFGCDSLIPLALSVQHGYSPTQAGLPLLVSALCWATGSWWQGRDALRAQRTSLIRAGFLLVALACLGAAAASVPSISGLLMYPAWALAGLGAGLAFSSFGVLVLDRTTDAARGRDSAALQLSDGVGTSVTTGFGGVMVAAAASRAVGYTAAFVTIDLVMVLVACLGAAVAGRARPGASGAGVRAGGRAGGAVVTAGRT